MSQCEFASTTSRLVPDLVVSQISCVILPTCPSFIPFLNIAMYLAKSGTRSEGGGE